MTHDPAVLKPASPARVQALSFMPSCHVAQAKRRRSSAHAEEILWNLLAPGELSVPIAPPRALPDLEAIGQMAAGVAHDLNNFLQVIGSSLEMLGRHVVADAKTQRLSGVARQALQRASSLTQQLLTMAHGQAFQAQSVALDDLDHRVGDLIRRALPSTIDVQVVADADLWTCTSDGYQLEAAILNLAINARDAMPDGGQITVTACNRSVASKAIDGIAGAPADYVVISVIDTGTGMEPQVMARAFEPFFTTKAIGKGTGLGLSRVRAFTEQCGGFVTMQSALLGGTTFALHLPRVAATLSS